MQTSHPLPYLSLPAFNLSQHQGLFQSQFFTSGGQGIGAYLCVILTEKLIQFNLAPIKSLALNYNLHLFYSIGLHVFSSIQSLSRV